jgi:hypothetical protein
MTKDFSFHLIFFGIPGTRFDKGKEYTVADGFLLRRAVC